MTQSVAQLVRAVATIRQQRRVRNQSDWRSFNLCLFDLFTIIVTVVENYKHYGRKISVFKNMIYMNTFTSGCTTTGTWTSRPSGKVYHRWSRTKCVHEKCNVSVLSNSQFSYCRSGVWDCNIPSDESFGLLWRWCVYHIWKSATSSYIPTVSENVSHRTTHCSQFDPGLNVFKNNWYYNVVCVECWCE